MGETKTNSDSLTSTAGSSEHTDATHETTSANELSTSGSIGAPESTSTGSDTSGTTGRRECESFTNCSSCMSQLNCCWYERNGLGK